MGYGATDDARHLMMTANLASFAWRSACVLRARPYALAPGQEAIDARLNDLAVMLACKALPEYYYDHFTAASPGCATPPSPPPPRWSARCSTSSPAASERWSG